MNKSNIYQDWKSSPYNDSNLAKKTYSYRLPVHIAARLAAISDMFPELSRSEIIIKILKAGLEEFEASLPELEHRSPTTEEKQELASLSPSELGIDELEGEENDEWMNRVKMPCGVRFEYTKTANKHYCELEIERGNKDPKPPFKP